MYNNYLQTLQKRFLSEFEQIEAGYNFDYGIEFELALCLALKNMLPKTYGICRGYVVASDGDTQGDDILVYEKSSHPSVTARDAKELLRKEKVPAEAVYTYIEAKHTIHLEGSGKQSLQMAIKQVSKVKLTISKRKPRLHSQLLPETEFNGINVTVPEGYPNIQNPAHGVIIARHVKRTSSAQKNMTDEQIFEALDTGEIEIAPQAGCSVDMIVLGEGVVILPAHKAAAGHIEYKAPFAHDGHTEYAIGRCPGRAFGVGLSSIAQAVEWISLGSMPWSKIALSGIDNFHQ